MINYDGNTLDIKSVFTINGTPTSPTSATINIYRGSSIVHTDTMTEIATGVFRALYYVPDGLFGDYLAITNFLYFGQTYSGIDTISILDRTPVNAAINTNKIERNRWKVDAGTKEWKYYDDDGVTEIARFALKDINGNPSIVNIAERVPIGS